MTDTTKQVMSGAGGLGMLVGIMSVLVGSQTLLGLTNPGYVTLDWLVAYNMALGVLAVFVGAAIRQHRQWTPKAAAGIFAAHFAVLGVVVALWSSSAAAPESVYAMLFRSVLWAGIAVVVWKVLGTKAAEPEPARAKRART
ncbi:MAG: hypothetical protein DRJ42_23275 [Deltaproteobacteria bacterium]|nr:MAG: hypothetical protein DRJ42_23275 [Deltaproteobacteria bacterium]